MASPALLEALSIASECATVGRQNVARDPALDDMRPLADSLGLSWRHRNPRGFFMRAEDLIGFAGRNKADV